MASSKRSQQVVETGPSEEVVDAVPVETSTDEPGTDLEAIETFRGSLVNQPELTSMMDWCVERSTMDAQDQYAVMEAEVRRILAGEDATQVLSESKPLSGKEFLNKPMRINGFTLTPTDFSEGWPFYANINATIDRDGTTAVINCGGPKVIAALMRLEQLDALPAYAMIKGDKTRRGFTVLSLVMPA